MKPVAYLETSVVSYLTVRPSRDVVVAAYQEITREWWRDASDRFVLAASALVIVEASAGEADADALTRSLLERGVVPREAAANAPTGDTSRIFQSR